MFYLKLLISASTKRNFQSLWITYLAFAIVFNKFEPKN